MHESGMVPGKDMSLIVYDDQLSFLQNSGDIPMFTSLRSSIQSAGRSSAEMLLDMINSNDTQPRNLLWEAELVLGSSTAPPRSL